MHAVCTTCGEQLTYSHFCIAHPLSTQAHQPQARAGINAKRKVGQEEEPREISRPADCPVVHCQFRQFLNQNEFFCPWVNPIFTWHYKEMPTQYWARLHIPSCFYELISKEKQVQDIFSKYLGEIYLRVDKHVKWHVFGGLASRKQACLVSSFHNQKLLKTSILSLSIVSSLFGVSYRTTLGT